MKTKRSEFPGDFMMSCPFAGLSQKVTSRAYSYDNSRRGSDRFVIVQRSESGSGWFVSRGVRREVPPGWAFLAVVPERSRYFFDSGIRRPWVFTWINLYGELAVRMARAMRDAHGPVIPLPADGEACRIFHSLAESADAKARDPWRHSSRCFEFVAAWMGAQARPTGSAADPIETAAGIMEQRFREPLCVKEVASEVGMTREHLSRLFAERHGIGPAGFLRRLRAGQASRLLEEGGLPLREIALRSGFPSTAALRRAKPMM